MSALTPPNDGFDLYLATIADNDSDFDDEADDVCEDCGQFRDACDCLDAELEDDETDDALSKKIARLSAKFRESAWYRDYRQTR